MVLHPGYNNNYGRKAFWNGEQCFYTRFNRTQVPRPRTVTCHVTTRSRQGNSTQTQACPVQVVVTMDNQVPEVVVDRYSYHKVFTEPCLVVAKRMQIADLCSTYLSSWHFNWPCSYFRELSLTCFYCWVFWLICWWRNFWSTFLTTGVNKLFAVTFSNAGTWGWSNVKQ